MVQVLGRPKSQGERFVESLTQAGPQMAQISQMLKGQQLESQEREALEKHLGLEKSGLPRDYLRDIGLQRERQKTEKLEEKRRGYEVGLGTIDAMKGLLPKLGPLEALTSPVQSMSARQSYTTYANSLLGILSTIPVRNQAEFENVKQALSSPWAPQEKIQAAIQSAEDIIKRHMESLGGEEKERPKQTPSTKKQKFDKSNPEHEAKARQLMKTFKDKEKVREALRREFDL